MRTEQLCLIVLGLLLHSATCQTAGTTPGTAGAVTTGGTTQGTPAPVTAGTTAAGTTAAGTSTTAAGTTAAGTTRGGTTGGATGGTAGTTGGATGNATGTTGTAGGATGGTAGTTGGTTGNATGTTGGATTGGATTGGGTTGGVAPPVITGFEGCFLRETGETLLVQGGQLFFQIPGNTLACHVFDFDSGLDQNSTSGGSFDITGSKCFVPGDVNCRQPASYSVQILSDRVTISTSNDFCCQRNQLLLGDWMSGSGCSDQCDCSQDCGQVAGCFTHSDRELNLSVEPGTFTVTDSASTACFLYPFSANSTGADAFGTAPITVGVDQCEPDNPNTLAERQRVCEDPEGTWFCSIRENTVTLFYMDDFCRSRCTTLGATFTQSQNCTTQCTCDVNAFLETQTNSPASVIKPLAAIVTLGAALAGISL